MPKESHFFTLYV